MPTYNTHMKYEAKLVNLTKKQATFLRRTSTHTGRPVSWFIREAVDQWMANRIKETKVYHTDA